MRLLLDTHIWISSLLDPAKLSRRVRAELETPDNELWLSPISVWELLILIEKGQLVRGRWTTPIEGWQEIDGRSLPTRGRAVWHMPEGEFAYADFALVPGALAFNVRPGE